MDLKNIIKEARNEFDRVISFFEKDITGIRTGRATPSLVENIVVDSYDSKMPVKQIASINIPGTRIIVIQPWDKSIIPNIEKAISQSDLGINPVSDNDSVKINLPPLTEEFRKKLIKILNEKSEEARISLRRSREEFWKEMQNGFKEGSIREDDKFKGKEDLQKTIDEYNKKIEDISSQKKKEIMDN
jgi:ribosome recycling factor